MVANLRDLVGKVSTTATALSASSVQMATTSQEAGRAVGEIASAVSDVAQGAERQVRVVESARDAAEHVSSRGHGVGRQRDADEPGGRAGA